MTQRQDPGRLRLLLLLFLLALGLAAGIASPAQAHKQHREGPAAGASATPTAPVSNQASPAGADKGIENAPSQATEASFADRLVDWLGRTHPILVHFPIALFPAALLVALIGRGREGAAVAVRALVIAGGLLGVVAALFGWFNALGARPGGLIDVHRWLGTVLGGGGLAIAIWAWLRPGRVTGAAMIAALALISAAMAVQGWYGGALVHGADHLDW